MRTLAPPGFRAKVKDWPKDPTPGGCAKLNQNFPECARQYSEPGSFSRFCAARLNYSET